MMKFVRNDRDLLPGLKMRPDVPRFYPRPSKLIHPDSRCLFVEDRSRFDIAVSRENMSSLTEITWDIGGRHIEHKRLLPPEIYLKPWRQSVGLDIHEERLPALHDVLDLPQIDASLSTRGIV